MPFTPNHLTTDQVEAIYAEVLAGIEQQELRGWLMRLQDPAAAPWLEEITRSREAVEADLKKSQDAWRRDMPPPGDDDAL